MDLEVGVDVQLNLLAGKGAHSRKSICQYTVHGGKIRVDKLT